MFVTHDIDEAIRLGDRMAVLNVGGVLEQYGPPADVLAEPANDFVVDFLGAERGLKRLSLVPVSSAELDAGPAARRATTPRGDARRLMADRSLRLGRAWSTTAACTAGSPKPTWTARPGSAT